jgi:hypothetical protein
MTLLLLSVLGLGAASASAQTDCRAIAAPVERLACYDQQFGGAVTPANEAPRSVATPTVAPTASDRRFWASFEQGAFATSKSGVHLGLVSGAPTMRFSTTAAPIPTAPGFIGLYTVQNLPGDPVNGVQLQGPTVGGLHAGETLHLGYWLDDKHSKGVEIEGMYLTGGSGSTQFLHSGNTLAVPNANLFGATGSYVISQPTTNATTMVYVNTTPAVFVHLYDQQVSTTTNGSLGAQANNGFYTLAANYRARVWQRRQDAALYVTAGMRYASFYERLSINSSSTVAQTTTVTYDPSLGLPGTPDYTNTLNAANSTSDLFRADNRFIGPEVGVSGDYHWRRFWVEGDAKFALGATFENLRIGGTSQSTTTTSTTPITTTMLAGIPLNIATGVPPVTASSNVAPPSGLFAQPANIGTHSSTVFALMPSSSVRFGYDLMRKRLSAFIGYRILYLSAVAQTSQAASTPSAVSFAQTGYWWQGVNFGVRAQF